MAGVDVDCVKIVPYGTIDAEQDWSTGWFFKVAGLATPPTTTQMATMLSGLESDLQYWFNALKGFCAGNTELLGVRGYFYPAHSGHSTVVSELALTTPIGGTSTANLPTQSSIVASLRTGVSGRSARGRSYFPATGMLLNGNAQLTDANCVTIAQKYGNVLADLSLDIASALGSSGVAPVIWSQKTTSTHQIIQVSVDSRPDIQRRRADKVAATYLETEPVTPH